MLDLTARLLPLNIVARRLRVPLRWLKAEAEAGRIPVLRADTTFLCELAAVEAVLLERVRQSGKDRDKGLFSAGDEAGSP
jgi:hypothetical protein